jgi:hypothetical protein
MRRELRAVAPAVDLELKAKGTQLTADGRVALDRFLDAGPRGGS